MCVYFDLLSNYQQKTVSALWTRMQPLFTRLDWHLIYNIYNNQPFAKLDLHLSFLSLFLITFAAIFGQSLDKTMAFEQERNPTRQVPEIVELCVEYIKANGLDAEGLFRFV